MITGNDFEKMFEDVERQEDQTEEGYINTIPSPCQGNLDNCDGSIGNPCEDGSELKCVPIGYTCVPECEPGYHIECVEDPVEYPPGIPVFSECDIINQINSQSGFYYYLTETTFLRVSAGNLYVFDKVAKTTKLISIPTPPEGYESGTTHSYSAIMINEKIISDYTYKRINDSFDGKRAIFDINGDFLEFWDMPDFWRVETSSVSQGVSIMCESPTDSNGAVVYITTGGTKYNTALSEETGLIGYDINGIIVKIIRKIPNIYSDYISSIASANGKYYVANQYLNSTNGVRVYDELFDSYTEIMLIGKQLDYDGAQTITSGDFVEALQSNNTSSDGKTRIIMTGAINNIGNEYRNVGCWIYVADDDEFIYINQPEGPICPDTTYEGELRFAQRPGDVSIFGDIILVTAYGAGCSASGNGEVYMYDLNGNFLSKQGTTVPLPGQDDKLGFGGIYMDYDNVYIYSNRYIKICKITRQ